MTRTTRTSRIMGTGKMCSTTRIMGITRTGTIRMTRTKDSMQYYIDHSNLFTS